MIQEGAEPNAYPNYTALQCSQQGDGVIATVMDTDYWRVQCAGPLTLRAFVGPGPGLPRIADTVLELRDAGNTLLASDDDGAGLGLYSEIRDFRIAAAGAYFLVVRGYLANTGSYSLDVSCGPPGPAWLPASEGAEPNQTNATARVSTCWNRFQGAIGFAADVDRYSFAASAGQMVTISTGPGSAGAAISDTTLSLLNGAGVTLASNDDSLGLYARISYVFPTSGTYYLDVAGYLNQVIGTYSLEFDCSGIQPSPASMTTLGIGCFSSFGQVPRIQRRIGPSGLTYVERPVIGTLMVADIVQCPPLSAVFVGAGAQEQNPPIDLAILGAAGCYAYTVPYLFDLHFADAAGVAHWSLALPYNQTLVGATLEYQGFVFDPPANPLGLVASNRLHIVAGNSF